MGENDTDISGEPPVIDAGLAVRYRAHGKRVLPIAPSHGDITNTVVPFPWPSPTACVKLDNDRFSFDSSFPHATMSADLPRLFAMRPRGTDAERIAIFGHADPTGSDEYNKTLSGRRAKAVYGLLTRNPELWDQLHQQPFEGDHWGIESLYDCLAHLGYEPGPERGRATKEHESAMHAFEDASGLPRTMRRQTRLALFGAYMDALVGAPAGEAWAYAPEDFVGEGKEPDHRGAFQGCGERNPAMVVSKAEDADLAKPKNHKQRNRVQAANRRVLIFLYAKEDVRDMSLWECPAAKAGPSACDKVAWSNKSERLKPGDKRREVRRAGRTFGCQFYDFTARLSPCEAVKGTVRIWIRDRAGKRYEAPVEYELRIGAIVRRGQTDLDGLLEEPNLPIAQSVGISWREPAASLVKGPHVALAFSIPGDRASVAGERSVADTEPTAISYNQFSRVFLPSEGTSSPRRRQEWLRDLGYLSPDEQNPALNRFASDYGLAVSAADEQKEKLLAEVHATGRETGSEAPVDSPSSDETPAAVVRPPCRCENAPQFTWTSGTSTFVSPIWQYLVNKSQVLSKMPGDLLFEMPLFSGTFLNKPFNDVPRPQRDSATMLLRRDHGDPRLRFLKDARVSGIGPEMKERLDWAQRRLWYFYCKERTAAGAATSKGDFESWLANAQRITAPHLTLRDGALSNDRSMHGDACAIDVGAGSAPFMCVRGKSGKLYGESHDVPTLPPFKPDPTHSAADQKKERAADDADRGASMLFFWSDNAFEPAMAAFDRASKLMFNKAADLTAVAGKFPLPRPTKSPCEEVTDHTEYAKSVADGWDRFDEANRAWMAYSAPETFAEFKLKVITEGKLAGEIFVDSDLITYAEKNTDAPISSLVPPTEPSGTSAYRRTRQQTAVSSGDLKGNVSRARAAYFQMLRDRERVAMVMVKGGLTAAPAAAAPPTAPARRVPCVWPDGYEVTIPDTRDVKQGFLGITRTVVVALVESGLTWLGVTGQSNGEPIADFTGDIMHFDLRTIYRVGSPEMDAWLEGNAARQSWQATIASVHELVGADGGTVRKTPTAPSLRQKLAVGGYSALSDAGPLVARLDAAKAKLDGLADADLALIVTGAKDAFAVLAAVRSKKQSAFLAKTEPSFQAAERALSAAMRSTTQAQAAAALADAQAISVPVTESTGAVISKYKAAFSLGEALTTQVGKLLERLVKRKGASTDAERKPLEASRQSFDAKAREAFTEAEK